MPSSQTAADPFNRVCQDIIDTKGFILVMCFLGSYLFVTGGTW